jgi:hypothetical protein
MMFQKKNFYWTPSQMGNCIACVKVSQETAKDKMGTEVQVEVEVLAVAVGVVIPVLLRGYQSEFQSSLGTSHRKPDANGHTQHLERTNSCS